MEVENEKNQKLPYFHRVLSKEEVELIGDISPKAIDKESVSCNQPSTTVHTTSVWNSAQTFEERSFNAWGIDKLKSILENFIATSSSYTLDITSSDVSGTCTIAHVRGKARYLYDFNVKLSVDISKDSNTYKGSLQVDDLSPDDLDDINIQISWTKEPPSSEYTTIKSFINKEFKTEFKKRVQQFEKEFRAI